MNKWIGWIGCFEKFGERMAGILIQNQNISKHPIHPIHPIHLFNSKLILK